jgi:hypothetical protein
MTWLTRQPGMFVSVGSRGVAGIAGQATAGASPRKARGTATRENGRVTDKTWEAARTLSGFGVMVCVGVFLGAHRLDGWVRRRCEMMTSPAQRRLSDHGTADRSSHELEDRFRSIVCGI